MSQKIDNNFYNILDDLSEEISTTIIFEQKKKKEEKKLRQIYYLMINVKKIILKA